MAIFPRKSSDGRRTSYMVRIESADSIPGHRKRVTVGTFSTKKAAEKAERDALVQGDSGTFVDPSTRTVGELLDAWLISKRSQVSSQSYVDYGTTIRRHLKPALGSIPVQRLSAAQVQAQIQKWEREGQSAHVIRNCSMRLSQALDQAVEFHLIPRNVCDSVKLPRLRRSKPNVWTVDEVSAFLTAAINDALHPLWHLLLLEGMRKGEALGLRWQDINLDRGTAHISQTVAADKASGGRTIIQQRTQTAAGARTVGLTPETLTALQDHHLRWLERKAAAPEWHDNDLIIATRVGTPINPANVRRSFDQLVQQTGLRRIRVHDLRHTSATLLLRAGVPAKIVSERLGHATTAITLDLYSHVLPDMQNQAAEAMSRVLASSNRG